MIGLDTNDPVSFLVADDRKQFKQAQRFIRSQVKRGEPALVSLPVVLEAEWLLPS